MQSSKLPTETPMRNLPSTPMAHSPNSLAQSRKHLHRSDTLPQERFRQFPHLNHSTKHNKLRLNILRDRDLGMSTPHKSRPSPLRWASPSPPTESNDHPPHRTRLPHILHLPTLHPTPMNQTRTRQPCHCSTAATPMHLLLPRPDLHTDPSHHTNRQSLAKSSLSHVGRQ